MTPEDYDSQSTKAEWDSPERAKALVEDYVQEGVKVLDIGIGTGQTVKGYREKGATVIGIDNDESMLAAAQEVAGSAAGSMRRSDINEELPVSDLEGQIDVVQAIGVLEFAKNVEEVFNQVVSTLKEGGVFVFTVERLEESSKRVEHFPGAGVTVYRHHPREVRELLTERGFTLLHEETYVGYDRGSSHRENVPYHLFLARKLTCS